MEPTDVIEPEVIGYATDVGGERMLGLDSLSEDPLAEPDERALAAFRASLEGPEAQFEFALARAQFAAAEEARAAARRLEAIQDALQLARTNPAVFCGPACDGGRQAVQFAERAAVAELSVGLSISESVVRNEATIACTLTAKLPRMWALRREGEVSYLKARAVCEIADSLTADADVLGEFDRRLSAAAPRLTVTKLRAKARVLRERLDAASAERRHAKVREDRCVWLEDADDGMTWLHALLPAEAAHRAHARVDANARQLTADAAEPRTLDQLRADVLADLLTGDGTDYEVRATVSLTIPVLTLLDAKSACPPDDAGPGAAFTRVPGHDNPAHDNPAVLNGCVPIDAETARRLCAVAPSMQRILTDPIDGAVLTVGRASYRPPADLARLTRARYPVCVFPGCTRRAEKCDLDHVRDWAHGGDTADDNLVPLCRKHHRLKHETNWRVKQVKGAGPPIRWTGPSGNGYDGDPPPW